MSELTYRGTELRPSDKSFRFWITAGLDDEASVRGEDTVVPGLAGRLTRDRVKDRRVIELQGYISSNGAGAGASEDAAREEYRDIIDTLHTIFDPTLDPGELIIYTPTAGVDSGKIRGLNARFLNAIWGPWIAGLNRTVSIQLECVDSPPEWVEADV
jgi:hypothetical protein